MKTIKWIGVFLCLSLWAAAQTSLAQTSTVVIAEIMYDNPLQDNEAVRAGVQGEFLSLYNYGEEDVNIGGWRVGITDITSLSKYTYTIPSGTMLPGMSLAVIASRSSSLFKIETFYGIAKPEGSNSIVLYTSSLAFPDTRSKVSIYNAQSVLEDEVTYDGISAALSGQILLRATNNVNSRRPISQTTSIQRQKIEVVEGNRVISRNDYYPATPAHTVQLFEYAPEEYSYTAPSTAYSSPPPANKTLFGTISGNSDIRATTINSTQVISSGKTAYWAEEEIVLSPGFEVKAGAEFTAFINRDSVNHIKILTYNVHGVKHWDYADHARVIKNSEADIASIQEVKYYGKYKTLKDDTGLSGDWFGSWPGVYGVAMLWNQSVVGSPITKSYKRIYNLWNDEDLVRVFIVAEFQDFCFVATHYSTVIEYGTKMTELLLDDKLVKKCINNEKPVYIAGDMNAKPDEEPITKLKDAGFVVLDTVIAPGRNRRIDLILEHNRNPYHKTLESGIPVNTGNWDLSDHFPYYSKVKIK